MTKDKKNLRSERWFGPDDLRSFGHRSRAMQMGYSAEDWQESRSSPLSIAGQISINATPISNPEPKMFGAAFYRQAAFPLNCRPCPCLNSL